MSVYKRKVSGHIHLTSICFFYARELALLPHVAPSSNSLSETASLENVQHRVTGKLVERAKPRPKPGVILSPICFLLRERKWIDINPERFRQHYFTVSQAMIRLLRHDPSIPREDDGAGRLRDSHHL